MIIRPEKHAGLSVSAYEITYQCHYLGLHYQKCWPSQLQYPWKAPRPENLMVAQNCGLLPDDGATAALYRPTAAPSTFYWHQH
jgi:hypothetical protein